jgi:hypothetical protein
MVPNVLNRTRMNDVLTAYYDDDAGQQPTGSQAELDELLDEPQASRGRPEAVAWEFAADSRRSVKTTS